jgi:hypothetical protein
MPIFAATSKLNMKHTSKLLLVVILLFASVQHASAQESKKATSPVRFLVGGALELGGDEVAKVYFTNGNDQSVKAGQGGSIFIGGELAIPSVERLLLQATVGFKYVTTAADNAHIRLTRFPIHLTANFLATQKLRIGAGLAMHRGIRFSADGIGPDMSFEGASGPRFEVAYGVVGLTYTAMTYKDQLKNSYSANAIGLALTVPIPKR